MAKPKRTAVLVIGLLACIGSLCWWLFGWSTEGPDGFTITADRFFGRVVRLSIDSDGDGRINETWRYSWKRQHFPHREPMEKISDTDRDGKWDTWATPVQDPDTVSSGELEWRYRLDTTGDSVADVDFVELDSMAAHIRINKEFGIE